MPGAVPLLKVVTDVRTTAAAAVAAAAPAAVAAAEVAVGEPAVLAVAVAGEKSLHMLSQKRRSAIVALYAAGDALGAGLPEVEGLVVSTRAVELGGGRTEVGSVSGRLVGEADG